MELEMTLKEVTGRIASKHDDVGLLARRIRHWTNEKLIETVDETHSGKGRHRRYRKREVLIAAILWELSKFNVPVGVLENIVTTLSGMEDFVRDNMEPELVPELWSGNIELWFAVTFDEENQKFECEFFNKDSFYKQQMENAIVIILNIAAIAERIDKP